MTISAPLPLAITLGDVTGIGPEIVVRALAEGAFPADCRPVVVGNVPCLERAAKMLGVAVRFAPVDRPSAASSPDATPVWDPWPQPHLVDAPLARVSGLAGRAAYEYLVAATRAALRGDVAAIVTAPLNKAALHAGGIRHPGHTEILAEECGVREFAMMLYLPPGEIVRGPAGLSVAHVTLHTSIASVPGLLSEAKIVESINLMDGFLRQMGLARPRIAVCALNPHGGEGGLFGDEESRIIEPAVNWARSDGIGVAGPYPVDTLIYRAVNGEFDGVVAMYHDQGHIPLKLIAFNKAVNVTLGLPIVRTSPSHGTGFDIAGKGIASPDGLASAARVALQLARGRGDAVR